MRIRALSLLLAGLVVVACSNWPGLSGDGGNGVSGGTSRFDDASGDLGSSCGAAVTCNAGLSCATGYPNGMCTKTCSSAADCAGGACVSDPSVGSICFRTCTSDITCRDGYNCGSPDGVSTVCEPGVANVFDAGTD